MKHLRIKFELELEVACDDAFDPKWIGDQYLSSERFSTLSFKGEPGAIWSAVSGVKKVVRIRSRQP